MIEPSARAFRDEDRPNEIRAERVLSPPRRSPPHGTFGRARRGASVAPPPFLSSPWVSPPIRRTSRRARRSSSRWWRAPPRVFASTAGSSHRAISPTRWMGDSGTPSCSPPRTSARLSCTRDSWTVCTRAASSPARATATSSSPTLPAPASAAAAPRSTSCFASRPPSATRGPPGASSSSTREATASAPPPTEPSAKPSANSPWTPPASASPPPSSRLSSSTSRPSPPRSPRRLRLIRRRRPPDGPSPPLDDRVRERVADGILALGHASPIEIGVGHGVFAGPRRTHRIRPTTRHRRRGRRESPSGTLECLRCLQKPSEAAQRDAGAVMPSPAAMGLPGGGGAEWVLTDSAFHVGWRACDALVRVAAAEPRTFAGVEVCAYGDFMQPMGEDADDAYLGGSTTSPAWREAPVGRVRLKMLGTGRTATGLGTVRGRAPPPPPPPDPRTNRPRVVCERLARRSLARFAVGLFSCFLCSRVVSCTWARCPSFCNTARAIRTCSRRFPRRPAASLWARGTPGAWRGCPAGAASARTGCGGRSIVRAGVVPSRVHARARRARGRGVAHRALRRGQRDRRGRGMPPARRRRAQGSVVPPGTFLHCVPLGGAAAAAAGIEPAAVPSDRADSSDESTASCWTCLALDVTDEVKRPGKSTLFGVPVEEAARRLGLIRDGRRGVVLGRTPNDDARATVPRVRHRREATAAALHLRATVTRDRLLATRTDASGAADERARTSRLRRRGVAIARRPPRRGVATRRAPTTRRRQDGGEAFGT